MPGGVAYLSLRAWLRSLETAPATSPRENTRCCQDVIPKNCQELHELQKIQHIPKHC